MTWNPKEHDPEWPFELMETTFALDPAHTALLVIDLQPSQITISDNDLLRQQYPHIADAYTGRVESLVMPNTIRLLDYFRNHQLKIAFSRNHFNTSTGQETTRRLKPKEPLTSGYRGCLDHDVDSRLSPRDNEVLVDKLTSSSFNCTFLDHALRNMGVSAVVVVGVLSDMCVLGTARGAAELGYDTIICEDACGTFTETAHTQAMLMHARKFGRIGQVDDILSELNQHA